MVIKEALICYLSEFGYNGFYYPSKEKGIIKQHSEYEILPWISGTQDSLSAIKIEKKNFLPLTLGDEGVKITLSKQEEIVVWIFKKDIPKETDNVKEPERKINQP